MNAITMKWSFFKLNDTILRFIKWVYHVFSSFSRLFDEIMPQCKFGSEWTSKTIDFMCFSLKTRKIDDFNDETVITAWKHRFYSVNPLKTWSPRHSDFNEPMSEKSINDMPQKVCKTCSKMKQVTESRSRKTPQTIPSQLKKPSPGMRMSLWTDFTLRLNITKQQKTPDFILLARERKTINTNKNEKHVARQY